MKQRNTFSTKFLLRASNRTKWGWIYCRIIVKGSRAEFSTQKKINKELWKNGRVKSSSEEGKIIRSYLKQIESHLFHHYRELLAQHKPISAEAIRNAYLGIEEEKQTLLELVAYHHNEMKNELAPGTLKNYRTTERYLKKFLKQKLRVSDIYLDQLSYKFIRAFEKYIKSTPLDAKNPCGQNGAMKHMERLCKMVNLALREEWIIRDPFVKFQLKFKKTERGYLTEEELLRIEEMFMPIRCLEIVRDLFVFGCYSGLSYIEVYNLCPKHITTGIDGEKWITGQRKKSEQFYSIPLLPQAMEILEKYKNDPKVLREGKCLPVFSNQKVNAYLKRIAKLCDIEKNLTFHLARHTFATTVTLGNDVPIESVSEMMGHTSLRTTQIYAKVIKKKVSRDMRRLREKLSKNQKQNARFSN